jgi:hypothetical protein
VRTRAITGECGIKPTPKPLTYGRFRAILADCGRPRKGVVVPEIGCERHCATRVSGKTGEVLGGQSTDVTPSYVQSAAAPPPQTTAQRAA